MANLEMGTAGKATLAHSEAKHGGEGAQEHGPPATPRSRAPLRWGALVFGVAVGLGMGWLGHDFYVRQAQRAADAAVKGKGVEAAGPCKGWTDTICARMGELAYECTQAKAASALLSGSACAQAREGVLAKIDILKAERAPCSELTRKLCADLGTETKGCELAKAKEPTFSSGDCQDMANNYRRVLAKIMERQERGTLPSPPRAPRSAVIIKPN